MAALQEQQAFTPSLDHRLRVMEESMPTLLNVISSTAGTHRLLRRELTALADSIDELRAQVERNGVAVEQQTARIETVRAETLFELRYSSADVVPERAPVRVVNPGALAAARSGQFRVNLGCGHVPLEGYVNVDVRDLPGVDVVAALDDLPFDAGEVDELFSSHVLEHFPEEQLRRMLLPAWAMLLRPGGSFRAVVPDAAAMLSAFAAGQMSYEDLREVTFGGQEYEGDFHFNMYTPESMATLLSGAGLTDLEVEAQGRRNGLCLEFQIVGRRPED